MHIFNTSITSLYRLCSLSQADDEPEMEAKARFTSLATGSTDSQGKNHLLDIESVLECLQDYGLNDTQSLRAWIKEEEFDSDALGRTWIIMLI